MTGRSPETAGAGPAEPLHERLRHRRLASGLDLEALARETKIQLRFLEAIELGQVHLLPQGVYMRNFIRIYLRAIGMDNPTEVQNIIDSLTSGVLRLPTPAGLTSSPSVGASPLPVRGIAIGVGAAMLLLLAGFALWRFVPRADTPAQVLAGGGQLTPGADQSPAPAAALPPTPVPQPSATPPPAGANMGLRAKRKVSVVLRGKSGWNKPMTLQKDETVEMFLTEPTTLEVSSAGAVEVTLKGRSVSTQRLRNSRTLTIDPMDFEELVEGSAAAATAAPETPP